MKSLNTSSPSSPMGTGGNVLADDTLEGSSHVCPEGIACSVSLASLSEKSDHRGLQPREGKVAAERR